MSTARKRTVLVLDDDEINLMILNKGVLEAGHIAKTFIASDEAWQYLQQNPDEVDIAVLDKMMPGINGIELLKRIKAHERLKYIPVVIQTGDAGVAQMREGLESGAYYYLTKPFHPTVLTALLHSAANECDLRDELRAQRHDGPDPLGLLQEGTFTIRTHQDARSLCAALSRGAAYPDFAATGLMELLANAIEHGTLAIGYERKRECLLAGTWAQELERRLSDPEFSTRTVRVQLRKTENSLYVIIADQGSGFDWHSECSGEETLLLNEPNGRGIAKAKVMLDDIRYIGAGNEVHCNIRLQPWHIRHPGSSDGIPSPVRRPA